MTDAVPDSNLQNGQEVEWPSIGLLLGLLSVYLLLRVAAWSNTVLLEDHDSVLYIRQIEAYLSLDPARIFALSPDSTPFYPFFGALFSLIAASPEAGARLCSLAFSSLLFVAIAGVLARLAGTRAAALGLVVLAISPYLVKFSISVLSEPTYVGVVYAGLWYYLASFRKQSLVHAAGLGLLFGLTFLNRLEGLIFILLVPLLKLVHIAIEHRTSRDSKMPVARWILVYVLCYMIVAIPQVLVVSDKMNRFALNGREVWADLQLAPDGGSYEERIYGLNHSATEINLTYLQRVPTETGSVDSGLNFLHLLETLLRNIDKFYAVQLGTLGGSLLVAFALLGALHLWRRRRFDELAVVTIFFFAVIFPGLATDPKPRAVAAGVPILAALSGIGILRIGREVTAVSRKRWLAAAGVTLPFVALATVWIVPFLGMYLQEKRENADYSLPALEPVVQSLMRDAAARSLGDVTIVARKQYLAYLADAEFVPLPFASYDRLVDYSRANRVDYLFVEHRLTAGFPFMETLATPKSRNEFERVHVSLDGYGEPLELYRMLDGTNDENSRR